MFKSFIPVMKESLNDIMLDAKTNSPYATWNLRKSITKRIEAPKSRDKIVWYVYSKIKYARRREYENKKNPHTKYYFTNRLASNRSNIQRKFEDNFKKILNKYK